MELDTGDGLSIMKYYVWGFFLGALIFALMYSIWHRKYSRTSFFRKICEEHDAIVDYCSYFICSLTVWLSTYLVRNLDGYINEFVHWWINQQG